MKKNEINMYKFSTSTSYDLYENGATVIGDYQEIQFNDKSQSHYHCLPPTDVPALTPAVLQSLIGFMGITGVVAV